MTHHIALVKVGNETKPLFIVQVFFFLNCNKQDIEKRIMKIDDRLQSDSHNKHERGNAY